MALYSKHRIDIAAATDSNAYAIKTFERTGAINEVARTDLTSQFGGVATITNTKTLTVSIAPTVTDISVIRMLYIESNAAVTVSLKDATQSSPSATTNNEIITLVLAGPSGAGSCKMFAEIAGFTTAAGDTLVLTAGASPALVTYQLWGDGIAES